MLLCFGLLLSAIMVQAQQIFHESFDADQTKEPFELGWYEFINQQEGDSWSINNTEQKVGEGCLLMTNSADFTGSWWQRAVKFRNLPLQEGKSYRLSFYLKGNSTYDGSNATNISFALMQGGENCDIPLLDADGNEFRFTNTISEDYVKISKMFYFASAELQKSTYAKNNPDKAPLEDTFFATLNVYNPGTFYLDDVNLEEATIAGVAYAADVIRVDFGYSTNIAALAKASELGRVLMPTDCATVTINGNPATLDYVELHQDGYLYLFLAEDNLEGGETVAVTFNNPEDAAYQILYQGTLTPGGIAPSFTEETTDFIEELAEIASYAYEEAKFVSSDPEDGAFGLDENITEITVNFDREVYTGENDINHGITAELTCGNFKEPLTVKAGTENLAKSIVFVRPSTEALAKGSYTVTVKDIVQERGTESANPAIITFEVGKIKVAEETITPIQTAGFEDFAAGDIPVGWTASNEGTILEQGTTAGSGPRIFAFATGGDATKAYYFRTTAVGNVSYIEYDEPVILPAGDLRIQFCGFCWKGSGLSVTAEMYDMDGNLLASQNGSFDEGVNGSTGAAPTCDKVTIAYKAEAETPVKLRISHTGAAGGYEELMYTGFVVNTYSKTEGESTEPEVVFADKTYGGANSVNAEDNCAPKEGSGWAIYQDGAKRTPGGNFNYNGTRIFALSIKNLPWAYYTNGNWNNGESHYVIYGEGGEGEPTLHLESGKHQFTYYAANWKVDNLELYSQIIDETGNFLVDRTDIITNCNMGGNRAASVETNKIQYTITIPAEGNYKMKFGGNNEMFVGNFTIEKLGSMAAYWYKQLDDVIVLAKEELARCEGEEYAGPTRDALQALVTKYDKTQELHTAAAYTEVIEQVKAATKAMTTRRENVVKFNSIKTDIETILAANAETKYAGLEVYQELSQVYEQYKDVAAVDLDDETLIATTATLSNDYTLLTNMINDGVGLLAYQITTLANKIGEIDATVLPEETVLAAANALNDDQALAKQLKMRLTSAIYGKFAAGEDLFTVHVDEEEGPGYDEPTTLDLHAYIQNSKLYSFATTHETTTIDMYPGWACDDESFNLRPDYGWGSYNASALHPVTDGFLGIGWCSDNGLNVWNDVSDLPVGKYNFIMGTMDRSGVGEITTEEGTTYNVTDSTVFLSTMYYGYVKASNAGDANGDGAVDVADITTIAAYILDNSKVPASLDNADANGDGVVDVADITATASIILNGPSTDGGEFTKVGEVPFNVSGIGQYYDLTDCTIPGIDITDGNIRLGAYIHATSSFACIDNARLEMTAKDPNFDYAKAKEEIDSKLSKLVNLTANHGDIISQHFYNANNEELTEATEGCIKIAVYKDGFMVVSIIR